MKHIYLTDCVSIFKVESIIVFIIFLLIKHWDCNQGYFKHREQRFFFFFFFVKYFVKLFDKIFKKSKKKITNGRGKRFPLLAIALSEVQRRPRKREKRKSIFGPPKSTCYVRSCRLNCDRSGKKAARKFHHALRRWFHRKKYWEISCGAWSTHFSRKIDLFDWNTCAILIDPLQKLTHFK